MQSDKMPKVKKKSIKKSAESEPRQLDLGFKQPISNNIIAWREKVAKFFRILEIRRFIRSPYTWIFIISAVALVIVQAYYLLNYYDVLPDILPVYFNSTELDQRLGQKWELTVFPALSGLIIIATTITGYQLYNSHKELISFSLVNMFVGVSILTLVLLRILAIYL